MVEHEWYNGSDAANGSTVATRKSGKDIHVLMALHRRVSTPPKITVAA